MPRRQQAAAPQYRDQALADPVGLLQVRIAGQDEFVDAERRGTRRSGRPPPRGCRPAPCLPRRGPGRRRPTGWVRPRARRSGRRAARPSAAAPRTARPAGWPGPARSRPGRGPSSSRCACGPRLVRGVPGDHVQPDAEAKLAASRLGPLPDRVELCGHRRRGLAPGQVHIGVAGRDVERGRGRPAQVDVRPVGGGHDLARRGCRSAGRRSRPARRVHSSRTTCRNSPARGYRSRLAEVVAEPLLLQRRRRRSPRSAAGGRRRCAGRWRPCARPAWVTSDRDGTRPGT